MLYLTKIYKPILIPITKIINVSKKCKNIIKSLQLLSQITITDSEFGTIIKINDNLIIDGNNILIKSQKDIILQSNTIDNYKIHLNPLSENLTYKNIKFSTTKPVPKPINAFSKK